MKMKMNGDGLLYKIILPDLLNNIVDQLNKNDNLLIPIDLNINLMDDMTDDFLLDVLELIKKKYNNIVFTYIVTYDNSEYSFTFNDQTYKMRKSFLFACKKYENNMISIGNDRNITYIVKYNNKSEKIYRIRIINGLYDSSAISY